jgi:nitrate reductase alpha subunit
VKLLGELNGKVADGAARGRPRIDTAHRRGRGDPALAPETNGDVAVKAWARCPASPASTTRIWPPRARTRRSASATSRRSRARSSPRRPGRDRIRARVSYNAGYTNVHELIPWRTLTGRQQLYQDHAWMRASARLCVYKPPVDTGSYAHMVGTRSNGNPERVLNFITPHQKWGIHSTYTDNLLMLTLSRGGPIVWMSEDDAKAIGAVDNDWIECSTRTARCARGRW